MTTTAISMMRSRSGIEPGHLEVDPDQVVVVGGRARLSMVIAGSRRKFSQHSSPCARTYTGAMILPRLDAVFAAALVASLAVRAWLRDAPGAPRRAPPRRGAGARSARRSSSAAHQKAADYTVAKARLGLLADGVRRRRAARLDAARRPRRAQRARCATASLPRAGMLAYAARAARRLRRRSAACSSCRSSWYSTFVIEERFGFNRMTWRLWLADTLKGVAGRRADRPAARSPLMLWLMGAAGRAVVALGLGARGWRSTSLLLVLYPTLHRAAVQQVRAARGRAAAGARRRR